jgi:hypothetical protein
MNIKILRILILFDLKLVNNNIIDPITINNKTHRSSPGPARFVGAFL